MFGVIVETRRWLFDANCLRAAVSASHSRPLTTVDSDTRFFSATAGVRVARGLFVVAGGKRVSTDLDVTLTGPVTQSPHNANTNPRLWDPMVGADYRGRLNSGIAFDTLFRVGGFGVGTDINLSAESAIDSNFAGRFVLRAGYSILYYKLTVDDASVDAIHRPLISKQTLHGPEIGLGVRF